MANTLAKRYAHSSEAPDPTTAALEAVLTADQLDPEKAEAAGAAGVSAEEVYKAAKRLPKCPSAQTP